MEKINEKSLISVCGESQINVNPDFVKINIFVSKISPTIAESQKFVNICVKKILKLLKGYSIDNIHTNSITFGQEYDYKDREKIFLGQKVEQFIKCKIYDPIKNNEKIQEILDKIVLNDDLSIYVSFDIDNHDKIITEARDAAYKNAFDKATRYAENAELKLIKAIKISEFEHGRDSKNLWYSSNRNSLASNEFGTEIPIGQISLNAKLYCDFIAE